MEPIGKQMNASLLDSSWWRKAFGALGVHKTVRRLRLCESVSLGEKRLVAVVEYDRQKFLVGGGVQSICLLARLGDSRDFSELLTEWCERQQ